MTHTDIDTGPALNRHPQRPPDGRAVSVLGTGMLGTVLTRALLRAGHPVTVWNRTAGKADALVASGATRAPTPAEAIAASPIVIASVSAYDDVQALLTPDAPEAPGVDRLAGRTLVNLSSGTPEQARTLSAWAAERGLRYLDGAAMSGTRLVGQPEALFLYSGDPEAYAANEATLAALGRAVHLGADPGAASVYDTALLAMNMGVLSGFYQAVGLVGAAGIDPPTFASVAVDYLPFVTGLLPGHARQIDQRRYPSDDGTLAVYAAAMGHVVDTGRRQGIDVELPAAITALLERGVAAGHGDDGVARLADLVAGR
jgi:3-hydroxyisobutyrate dehydrogenase-like beta-hydroxyacid dehydrogenase